MGGRDAGAATLGPRRHAFHGTHEVETPPNHLVADCGTIDRAAEDAEAIAHAPEDVAWLLAEVERLGREAARWETMWREDTEPTCPVSGRPCASPLCRDMGCDLVTDLEPDNERLAERSASKPDR